MNEALKVLALLGESKLLVPACALAVLCLMRDAPARAWRWMAGLGLAGAAVLATKLAFLGWGIGSATLDFTGISGHAMVSMAIYPVLGFGLGNTQGRNAARALCGLGVALALAIAVSRVLISAHSWFEVASGVFLGALVSAWVLAAWPADRMGLRVAAVVFGFLLSAAAGDVMAPKVRTHDVVVTLALHLAGRDHPYTRESLHVRSAGAEQWRPPPALRAGFASGGRGRAETAL